MKTLMLACVLSLGLASVASAQAVGTSKLEFDQQAATLAEANALTYRYYPDALAVGSPLTPVTCTGTTAPFVCSAPFPPFTPGPHTLTVTAGNAAGESLKSLPFTFTFVVIPAIPINLRIR